MNLSHLKFHSRHCIAADLGIFTRKIRLLLSIIRVHKPTLIGLCCNGQTCSSLTGRTSGLPYVQLVGDVILGGDCTYKSAEPIRGID